ncbi:hypothetical protein J5J86_20330 [Aquabacter sp. L1I39]|uniref:DUF6968 family protein n=1 Tax=Aquabacter sp. L1I39 TaxID=2820278 RepID=UPI001ADD3E52|nr:hypothetical protein [Aquabacter sp. L1I39]QTL03080.1 hypothetical protein J5J86_20330 [Aquabacter sp. L1I39]
MLVLTHHLYLKTRKGERAFDIRVFQPVQLQVPVGTAWSCRYEIDWPDGPVKSEGFGFDALQALMSALKMVGAEIYSTTYHREGRLRAYETEEGYGFPVASSLQDLLVGVDAI